MAHRKSHKNKRQVFDRLPMSSLPHIRGDIHRGRRPGVPLFHSPNRPAQDMGYQQIPNGHHDHHRNGGDRGRYMQRSMSVSAARSRSMERLFGPAYVGPPQLSLPPDACEIAYDDRPISAGAWSQQGRREKLHRSISEMDTPSLQYYHQHQQQPLGHGSYISNGSVVNRLNAQHPRRPLLKQMSVDSAQQGFFTQSTSFSDQPPNGSRLPSHSKNKATKVQVQDRAYNSSSGEIIGKLRRSRSVESVDSIGGRARIQHDPCKKLNGSQQTRQNTHKTCDNANLHELDIAGTGNHISNQTVERENANQLPQGRMMIAERETRPHQLQTTATHWRNDNLTSHPHFNGANGKPAEGAWPQQINHENKSISPVGTNTLTFNGLDSHSNLLDQQGSGDTKKDEAGTAQSVVLRRQKSAEENTDQKTGGGRKKVPPPPPKRSSSINLESVTEEQDINMRYPSNSQTGFGGNMAPKIQPGGRSHNPAPSAGGFYNGGHHGQDLNSEYFPAPDTKGFYYDSRTLPRNMKLSAKQREKLSLLKQQQQEQLQLQQQQRQQMEAASGRPLRKNSYFASTPDLLEASGSVSPQGHFGVPVAQHSQAGPTSPPPLNISHTPIFRNPPIFEDDDFDEPIKDYTTVSASLPRGYKSKKFSLSLKKKDKPPKISEGSTQFLNGHTPQNNTRPVLLRQSSDSAFLQARQRFKSEPDLLTVNENQWNDPRTQFAGEPYDGNGFWRSDAGPKVVVLQKGPSGFGFVLRGARSHDEQAGSLEFRPSPDFPALQYLDRVDPGGMAHRAGLKSGDFLIEINNVNVVQATHEAAVRLIKESGSTLALKVVRVSTPLELRHARTPQPERRDARPETVAGTFPRKKETLEDLDQAIAEYDSTSEGRSEKSSPTGSTNSQQILAKAAAAEATLRQDKTASIRSRPSSRRISAVELQEIFTRQGSSPGDVLIDTDRSASNLAKPKVPVPKTYANTSELKAKIRHRKPADLTKSRSTPDLTQLDDNDRIGALTLDGKGSLSRVDVSPYATSNVQRQQALAAEKSAHLHQVAHNDSEDSGHSTSSSARWSPKSEDRASGTIYAEPYLHAHNRPQSSTQDNYRHAPPSTAPPPRPMTMAVGGQPAHYFGEIPPPPNHPPPTPPKFKHRVPEPPPSQMVKINTRENIYANVSQEIQKSKAAGANKTPPVESSFRPGNYARLKDPETVTKQQIQSHMESIVGSVTSVKQVMRQVSAPVPPVVGADIHRETSPPPNEPEPDYDTEDVNKTERDLQRQYDVNNVVPPPPPSYAPPEPPAQHPRSREPTPQMDRRETRNTPPMKRIEKVEKGEKAPTKAAPPPPASAPPPPPPASAPPAPPPPPPASAPPPAPPPPPPLGAQPQTTGSVAKAPQHKQQQPPKASPATERPTIQAHDLMAALQKRQSRMATADASAAKQEQSIEQKIQQNKSKQQKSSVDHLDVLSAAVAKRREMVQQRSGEDIADSIEKRLAKNKKVQMAFGRPLPDDKKEQQQEKKPDLNKQPSKPATETQKVPEKKVEAKQPPPPTAAKPQLKIDTSKPEEATLKEPTDPKNSGPYSPRKSMMVEETETVQLSPPPHVMAAAAAVGAKEQDKEDEVIAVTTSVSSNGSVKHDIEMAPPTQPKPAVKVPPPVASKPNRPSPERVIEKKTEKPQSPVTEEAKQPALDMSIKSVDTQKAETNFLAMAEKARQKYLLQRKSQEKHKPDAKKVNDMAKNENNNNNSAAPSNITKQSLRNSQSPRNSQERENKRSSGNFDPGQILQPPSLRPVKKPGTPKSTTIFIFGATDNESTDLKSPEKEQASPVKEKPAEKVVEEPQSNFVFEEALPPPVLDNGDDKSGEDSSTKLDKFDGDSLLNGQSFTSSDNVSSTDMEIDSMTTIEVIPPPPSFSGSDTALNVSSGKGSSTHAFEDNASLLSSGSTMSSLSDRDFAPYESPRPGRGGIDLSLEPTIPEVFDDDLIVMPPPPPQFTDTTESVVVPPPAEFSSSDSTEAYVASLPPPVMQERKPMGPLRPFEIKSITDWTCDDVSDWLDDLKLSEYKTIFVENDIDGQNLATLTRNDFLELGVSRVGHRMNMERAIKKAVANSNIV
ncbi:SH3 and multiple ankyrin repeat domains protein 2 isoform X2 [Lingula anatina]|uniref:SH3 and multiple ankyrin repeat domains protein 2 isoform X2 n=1 Tax=Lingula anatina TaxID=7574 RepID=A0A1S3JDL5_LINAN|nr:SH3 and multiple ankyrin repeat domains protein 2 isoform X2 [Lingula anatina]|eukprot:XP_013407979.1 SH3 and multiple ankyrin repeat domains protein 2 isoform X2 [Lingula anatina]